jgi:hypothetical protein
MWPPDYTQEFNRRVKLKKRLDGDVELRNKVLLHYANNPVDWINDWGITYDPRVKPPLPKTLPFVLFDRQVQMVEWIMGCIFDKENGLCEKSRDMGASWICVAISVWFWLFKGQISIGFGSQKQEKVDKLGDPDALLEKMRMQLRWLPSWQMPDSYDEKKHATFMRLVNPMTGATITGDVGDNIGRGGRKTFYIKDESAHYERPELIEAALGDTTDVQIDISSVKGANNVFYRRRKAGEVWHPGSTKTKGKVCVLILDWREHPHKTPEWYKLREEKAASEGLLHVFRQEVDRDYTSALDRVIIPNAWIKSAIDAHKKLGFEPSGLKISAQDVKDEGADKHAYAMRHGVVLQYSEDWGEGDGGEAARKCQKKSLELGCAEHYYDSVGVGAAVKSEINRMVKEKIKVVKSYAWAGQGKVLKPDKKLIPDDPTSQKQKDFFRNLKSQGWWGLRTRFEKTHKAIHNGAVYSPDELISLDSSIEKLAEIEMELSQATWDTNASGKLIVDKAPEGAPSPNMADAIVICFHPNKKPSILDVI